LEAIDDVLAAHEGVIAHAFEANACCRPPDRFRDAPHDT